MKATLLIVFIVLFVVLLLVYPFKIKGAFHFNAIEDVGFVVLKVFVIKLVCMRFRFNNKGGLELKKYKKKKKKKKPVTLLGSYFMSLAKKLDVKKIQFFFSSGVPDNAYLVCMVNGAVETISASMFAVLLNKYKHLKIFSDVDPVFNENKLEVTASVVVSFCLLDMLLSVIHAYIYYFKLLRRAKKHG